VRESAQLSALSKRELEEASFLEREEGSFSERELEEASFSEKRIAETCLCKRMMEERPFLRLYEVG
jgi:hypothetical protein